MWKLTLFYLIENKQHFPKKKLFRNNYFFLGSVFFVFSIFNELEELYKAKKKSYV
jgi:hypothetical protein